MSNGSIFSARVAEFVAKAKGKETLVYRKVALDMFSRVIQKSPVLTGRFRGNWQCAIGSIPGGTLAVDDKAGDATIAKVAAETARLKAGETIFLINNLDYARPLEFGWSQQAPNGMVRLTLVEFAGIVEQAASTYAGIGPWQT